MCPESAYDLFFLGGAPSARLIFATILCVGFAVEVVVAAFAAHSWNTRKKIAESKPIKELGR